MRKILKKVHPIFDSGFTLPFFVLAATVAAVVFASLMITEQKSVRLLFVGDMMFDRTMRKIADVKGYDHLFSCTKEYLQSFDGVIGNLEGPIIDLPSKSLTTKPGEAGNTTFVFDPKVAKTLASHNISFVSLGNNHIFDFGKVGAEITKEYLSEHDVGYFGVPYENPTASTTINGIRIAFVGFNQFLGQNNPSKTKEAIWKAKRENDVVIVYTHWGDEYVKANEYQKSLAHGFVDAGADMVIGSHPHLIQEDEIYGGKHIYYSLGNFIFDQYWEEAVRTGGGLEVLLSKTGISVNEKIFDISRDGTTCLRK